ncbi:hypothetical protein S40285_10396 [Stachybotrys chlorohalonatus IBT 40285]|uniref:Uncharacterized protein n=1 Tax=Stachybotrys chlorohalonatus (strain IBT 40285) TaxID=1283841 RepID=A0A084QPB9_STAC4|nr:hypothetical protein S40285_10396 [Stachybotrys chlorohalonata IBT 40285]
MDAQAALARSRKHATALQKQLDRSTPELIGLKDIIRILEAAVAEAQKMESLAEAEFKKHLNKDLSEDIIIDGLEQVLQV